MRSSVLIALVGLVLAFVPMQNRGLASEAQPLSQVLATARFEEPLVPTSTTSDREDSDLSTAIERYSQTSDPQFLTQFLQAHEGSGWSSAISLNLGLVALREGRFTDALAAWKNSWTAGRDATSPDARILVDRAVGELAKLEAALGRYDQLEELLGELGSRPVAGPATEALQIAVEALHLSKTDPRHLFLCGPLALQALLETAGLSAQDVAFLSYYVASSKGTNLAELQQLAQRANVATQVVLRKSGEAVPVPSIVHWKVGHFAAVVGREGGKYHLKDPVFTNRDLWMTEDAIDSESSGYFLTLDQGGNFTTWQQVAEAEAETIWGKGPTNGTTSGSGRETDVRACPECLNKGLPGYNILESTVSLTLSDNPVGYRPPIGPSVQAQVSYNQREDSQPAVFSFFNMGPKWTLGWLSYVTDDPTTPGINVSRFLREGGAYFYSDYNAGSGQFAAQTNDGSRLVLASQSPITYRVQHGDGSVEIYAESNGAVAYPRRVFLSQIIDPQGNALTLTYDAQLRLTSLTDATGRQTTLSYTHPNQLLVTSIADPFGRAARFTYDPSGRLQTITDTIGLTATFGYDANSLVNSMTTPYGTTSFAYTAPGTSSPPRYVQVTDPMGFSEREEWLEPAPIPSSDPAGSVPQGMPNAPVNAFLTYRNSFHWDKHAYVEAGCTPSGGCDYTKARVRHFAHDAANPGKKSMTIESEKNALEGRVWYNYPGQGSSSDSGTSTQPTAIGRVLDDGSTQLRLFEYDTAGYFKPTNIIDPLGRATSIAYSNSIDLVSISQTTEFGVKQTVAQFIYNTMHRPIFYTDAAGETTQFAYNGAGQPTSITNAKGEVTSYSYSGTGDLLNVTNANGQTQASYTYDAFSRVLTSTDSEGWTVTYAYDAADRVTRVTYPDGTSDSFGYDKLDLFAYRDRLGRNWSYAHDANRRLVSVVDPDGQSISLGYNENGQLTLLEDFNGNPTSWDYDVEGRVISKIYADSSTVVTSYETTTSRVQSVLDALGQTRQYSYFKDDDLSLIEYLGALSPTPDVSFTYDQYFPRITSMTDGTGTTNYSYGVVGTLGALQLAEDDGPLASSAIHVGYDELGRAISKQVEGQPTETVTFDPIGRVSTHASELGIFGLTYLGQTNQPLARSLTGTTISTDWTYGSNAEDRRLSSVTNTGFTAGQFTTFQLTSLPGGVLTGSSQTSDQPISYPPIQALTATYNDLNQLTLLNAQSLTYDANGNLTSDGQRSFAWDAENRLVAITYAAQPGKKTEFAYDGIGRRSSKIETPVGGGSSTVTYYRWCGFEICQSRDASNAPARAYFWEGEVISGSPSQPVYYGIDQVGSVRRAFVSVGLALAYDYDAFGNLISPTAPVADVGYAGLFEEVSSGLDLAGLRQYDAQIGRWLSRDPLEELSATFGWRSLGGLLSLDETISASASLPHDPSDLLGHVLEARLNPYTYVENDPLRQIDPSGLQGFDVYTINSRGERIKISVPYDPTGRAICSVGIPSPVIDIRVNEGRKSRLELLEDILSNYAGLG